MYRKGEVIGVGNDKRIYADAITPETRVIAEFRKEQTPEEIKSVYYLGNIAHILFPQNVPKVYEAGMHPQEHTKVERKKVDVNHKNTADLMVTYEDYFMGDGETGPSSEEDSVMDVDIEKKETDPRVKQLLTKASSVGLYFDTGGQNFSFDDLGTVQYLEVNPAFHIEKNHVRLHFNESKLRDAIQALENEKEKKKATLYFERLMSLIQVAQNNLIQ
ncbi:MAG TPA: hypothetical protein DIS59_00175 [Candidatus Magasanikbacteria bacterium]|nr:hypothetical protein [Candidatus Magasanikbacteria bacterium]